MARERPIAANHRSISASGIKPLTIALWQSDRRETPQTGGPTSEPRHHRHGSNSEQKGFAMKKFGFASAIVAGFATAVFGLAAPAQADVTHNQWVHDIQHQATVGSVTSVFGNGR
ncbi:hypothetical protein [Mycobacterium aquaticum]|uniref:hypothetical protein n=1 Tax=Mycobacterium aquaticum TaxID=1927124 RepID=UPI0014752EBD|nr:hypothetical protein [Mycobacterium aquaticum]